jgi:hypothetical protein
MIFIGDTHGKFTSYLQIAKQHEHTFQLGDFGFGDSWNQLVYSDLDPKFHKVGQGNHDPHSMLQQSKPSHWTGRFANISLGNHEIFWIGGALSIDLVYRVGEWMSCNRNPAKKTWWATEQLDFEEMKECEKLWIATKPKIVATHTCPDFLIGNFNSNKSGNIMEQFGWDCDYHDMTSQYLNHLWKLHKPDLWMFGHFHNSHQEQVENTKFICLAELEIYKLN